MLVSYNRIALSLLLSVIIHSLIIMHLYYAHIKYRKSKVYIITGIDIIQPYLEEEKPITIERPKSIFNILQAILFKKEEKISKPLDIEKPEKLKEIIKPEEKLVDKGLLDRKKDFITLTELEKKKKEPLETLVLNKTKEEAFPIKDFIKEEKLKERDTPLVKNLPQEIIPLAEMGREKAKSLESSIKIEMTSRAGVSKEEEKIKELIKVDPMISLEKKDRLVSREREALPEEAIKGRDISKEPTIKMSEKTIERDRSKLDALLQNITNYPFEGEKKAVEKKIVALPKVIKISPESNTHAPSNPMASQETEEEKTEKKALKREESLEDIFKKPKDREVKSSPKDIKIFNISGPLSRRKIVKYEVPSYPEWAKRQAIEAEVRIHFYVTPEGFVEDRSYIYTTSGFVELDRLALSTIKKWLFDPLPKDTSQEDQWGIITFCFVLE